jgi:hypothetical protein
MATRGKDGRKATRVPVEIPVTIVGVGGVATLSGRRAIPALFDTQDLSLAGAFLRASSLLELGERVDLEFALGGGRTVQAKARVVRVQTSSPSGIAVQFDEISEDARAALRTHLTSRR